MLSPLRLESIKIPIFTTRQRAVYLVLVGSWILANIVFWTWWLDPGHRGNPWLFWPVSLAFFYEGTLLPTMFLYYLGQMRKPEHISASAAKDVVNRVAMVTPTVPGSETIDIVDRQLKALQRVRYPHDSWVLVDKVHSPEIKERALTYGVKYFSRHDVERWGEQTIAYWNQPNPPFQAKTKAGNINAWIDAFGHEYSHFTQLDIDHIPAEDYLDRVLGYFYDPKVAWVQAPSVYGNMDAWTAKGSTEQEFVLQGPLQMGFYGATSTPFIIGSHATYDMRAINEIGGFQPTRAEDHLDTLYLASRGYTGVFVPDVIATGDGPETFETYLAQQFAWAYSLMQVLMYHTPKMIWKLPPRLALQMLFCESWYPLWSVSMAILFVAPIGALLSGQHIAQVSLWELTARSSGVSVVAFGAWLWSRPWHQPKGRGLSWRAVILHLARWSIVLNANIQAVLRVRKPYMITPKGTGNSYVLRPHALMPYLFLACICLLANVFYLYQIKTGTTQGYLLFTLMEALGMLLVCVTPFAIGLRKAGVKSLAYQKLNISLLLICWLSLLLVTIYSEPGIREALYYSDNPSASAQMNERPGWTSRTHSASLDHSRIGNSAERK